MGSNAGKLAYDLFFKFLRGKKLKLEIEKKKQNVNQS